MNWTTLYISGRPGFERELQSKLERSDLPIMNGAAGLPSGTWLCWVDEQVPLRSVKQALGADLIWTYRLRFSKQIEAEMDRYDHPFTEREKEIMQIRTKRVKKNYAQARSIILSAADDNL